MTRYINKEQVIEWVKQRLIPIVTDGNTDDWERGSNNERINFLSFINSLPEETNIKLLHFPSKISMSDKVQLIKKEIERQIEEGNVKCQQSKENNDYESFVAWSEHVATCGQLLVFIDSIPEEPVSEDLEEEFNRFLDEEEGVPRMWHSDEQMEWGMDIARHFAEWQKRLQFRNAQQSEIYGTNIATAEEGTTEYGS